MRIVKNDRLRFKQIFLTFWYVLEVRVIDFLSIFFNLTQENYIAMFLYCLENISIMNSNTLRKPNRFIIFMKFTCLSDQKNGYLFKSSFSFWASRCLCPSLFSSSCFSMSNSRSLSFCSFRSRRF